jgi:hypothetical protein
VLNPSEQRVTVKCQGVEGTTPAALSVISCNFHLPCFTCSQQNHNNRYLILRPKRVYSRRLLFQSEEAAGAGS